MIELTLYLAYGAILFSIIMFIIILRKPKEIGKKIKPISNNNVYRNLKRNKNSIAKRFKQLNGEDNHGK
jgi:hypothetical protein